jgi:hypothetical protein
VGLQRKLPGLHAQSLEGVLIWPRVGRPAGEPKARCTAAVAPHPRTRAATTSFGYASPRYIEARPTTARALRPSTRAGRVRYGAAPATMAVATPRRRRGNDGPVPNRTKP